MYKKSDLPIWMHLNDAKASVAAAGNPNSTDHSVTRYKLRFGSVAAAAA
jgi:hypothetical protein